MPKWFTPRVTGIALAIVLALTVTGMALTADRTAYHLLEPNDANRSMAESTARLATYQVAAFVITIPTLTACMAKRRSLGDRGLGDRAAVKPVVLSQLVGAAAPPPS